MQVHVCQETCDNWTWECMHEHASDDLCAKCALTQKPSETKRIWNPRLMHTCVFSGEASITIGGYITRIHKRNRSRKICISTGLFHITFTLHSSGIQIVTYYWGLNASFLNQNENELNPSLLIRDCSFCVNMNQKFHFFCLGLPPRICIKYVVFLETNPAFFGSRVVWCAPVL